MEDLARLLNEASTDLINACETLDLARIRLAEARSAEIAAVNQVNAAQKRFAEHEAAMRRLTSYQGTDWCRAQAVGDSVAC